MKIFQSISAGKTHPARRITPFHRITFSHPTTTARPHPPKPPAPAPTAGELDGSTRINPGHLFIKIGGAAPGYSPLANTTGIIDNVYGYNYAVDLVSGNVYNLTPDSDLKSTTYDFLGSNPWKYAGLDADDTADRTFYAATTPAGVVATTGESSFSTLLGDAGVANNTHYVVDVDLSDFMALNAGDNIWFHYAEECGNDSMRGLYHVPDAGNTLLLLGFGLAGLAFLRPARLRQV